MESLRELKQELFDLENDYDNTGHKEVSNFIDKKIKEVEAKIKKMN